jgi:hypothetical protein
MMVDMAVIIGGTDENVAALQAVLSPLVLERADPVYISACERGRAGVVRRPAHERGVTLAHRNVWNAATRRGSKRTLIFEGDATPVSETAATAVAKASRSDADIFYLGWCYGIPGQSQPLCCHAYMLSAKAVSCLLDMVPVNGCTPRQKLAPLDHLFRTAARRYGLTWELAEDPWDAPGHWTKGPFHQIGDEDPDS